MAVLGELHLYSSKQEEVEFTAPSLCDQHKQPLKSLKYVLIGIKSQLVAQENPHVGDSRVHRLTTRRKRPDLIK